MKSDVTRSYSEKELVATFRDKPLSFEPGSKWEYSNSAYTLLGFIIQKVTKKPYEQVMRERILQPLQMANSGFDFTHLNNSNKAKGYFSLRPEKAMPAPVVDSTIAYAAGALYSTVDDLYKWERAIYTNKILMPESWKRTFTPLKNKYGYGWGIDTLYGKNYTAHSGGIHGFSSYLMRFPEDELAIIALSNSSSNVGKLTRDLAAVFYDQPYEITKAKEEIKLEPSALQQYTGVYKLAPNFSITITAEGSQLKAQATGQPIAEIYPQKENFFFYKVVDAQIEFQKDEKGAVTSLVLHQNGQQIKGEKKP
jgi:CubicO group peptidase (beta-lactamase class C family)